MHPFPALRPAVVGSPEPIFPTSAVLSLWKHLYLVLLRGILLPGISTSPHILYHREVEWCILLASLEGKTELPFPLFFSWEPAAHTSLLSALLLRVFGFIWGLTPEKAAWPCAAGTKWVIVCSILMLPISPLTIDISHILQFINNKADSLAPITSFFVLFLWWFWFRMRKASVIYWALSEPSTLTISLSLLRTTTVYHSQRWLGHLPMTPSS